MYVVYRLFAAESRGFEGRKYVMGKSKISEHETLEEANEKIKKLNDKNSNELYTIILEP